MHSRRFHNVRNSGPISPHFGTMQWRPTRRYLKEIVEKIHLKFLRPIERLSERYLKETLGRFLKVIAQGFAEVFFQEFQKQFLKIFPNKMLKGLHRKFSMRLLEGIIRGFLEKFLSGFLIEFLIWFRLELHKKIPEIYSSNSCGNNLTDSQVIP